MKTITAFLLLLAVCAEGRAALQFEGFLSDSGSVRFVLSNSESGRRSPWLSIGDSFEGHKVVSFDAKSEVLTLQTARETLRLFLKPPATTEGEPPQPQKGMIVVYLGKDRRLVVTNAPSRLDSLRVELERAASADPMQPVRLQLGPYQTDIGFAKAVLEICRESGLKRVSLDMSPPEVRPKG